MTMTDNTTEAPTAPTNPAATEDEPTSRRGRGDLEHDVKLLCDAFVTGSLTLGDGEHLTPHRIAKEIKNRDGLDETPSTGAVASVLDRWVKYGFAVLNDKPKAFVGYTDAGRTDGLSALKKNYAEKQKAAKAAAKAAENAANGE